MMPDRPDMAGADDADDEGVRVLPEVCGNRFRHAAVPHRLRLGEGGEGLFAAHAVGVMVEDDAQQLQIVGGRFCRPRHAFLLRLGHRVPAVAGNRVDQRPLDVHRQHRQPVHPREVEQWQIVARVESPDFLPFGFAQERGFAQFACHPAVEDRLQPPRKHFQRQREARMPDVQLRQRVQLPTMVFGLVVRLAEQDHLPVCQPVDEGTGRQRGRVGKAPVGLRREPLADLAAGRGRRGGGRRRRGGREERGSACGERQGEGGGSGGEPPEQVGAHADSLRRGVFGLRDYAALYPRGGIGRLTRRQRSRIIAGMGNRRRLPPLSDLLIGLAVIGCGLAPLLAAFDIGPLRRADINGPPWLALVAGGVFVAAGLVVLFGRQVRGLRAVFGLVILFGLAALGNWVAFGAGERACSGSLSFAFLFFRGELAGWQCRLPFALGALIANALCVYATVLTLQRLRGGPPALARAKRAAEGLLVLSLAPLLLPLLLFMAVGIVYAVCRERLRTGTWPRNEAFIARQRGKGLLRRFGKGPDG